MLPPLLDVAEVQARLQAVFPEGSPRRTYCVREMAARTVFVMLYVGAVEGTDTWVGPGLRIRSDRVLPDTILVDLAPAEPLVVFVEAVATDGPVTAARRDALLDLLTAAGFKAGQAAFVTAFEDRDTPAFRKAVADLVWGSFAWCLTEPDHLIAFDGRDAGAAGLLHGFGKPQEDA